MTTELEVKATRQLSYEKSTGKPTLDQIDLMRAFLVRAIDQGIYKPMYHPDLVSVSMDADDDGYHVDDDVACEAICIAATLEGIPLIYMGKDPQRIWVPEPYERRLWKRLFAEEVVKKWARAGRNIRP
jgi:hypothetical protein